MSERKGGLPPFGIPGVSPPALPKHADANKLTPSAEVAECRRILGEARQPSWWAVALDYLEQFDREKEKR